MPIKIITINDLDSSQRRIVNMRPFDSSMYVSGPPGSGKTSVAILRTKMILDNGFSNVMFLLYNHSLYGYLNKIFSKMKITNSINIQTKDQFFYRLAMNMGCHNNNYEPYEVKYAGWLRAIMSASDSSLPSCQLLIMDESQDFSDAELAILKRMSKKMLALADFDQQLYGKHGTPAAFGSLPHIELETIYRFGKEIAEIAQPFSASATNLITKVTKTGFTPAYRVHTNPSNEISVISQIIKNKMVADGTMAILSPAKASLEKLSRMLRSEGINHFYSTNNKDLREYDFDSKCPLLITANSAKGLEFDTVILYKYTRSSMYVENKKEILYMSLTRTCSELYVLEDSETCDELRNLRGLREMSDSRNNDINDF